MAAPEDAATNVPISAACLDEAASDTAASAQVTAIATVYDGIVIGAGLAGLKAAADLKANGFNVLVLEGRSRIGGRVFTTSLSSGTTRVEAGAQWFHGNNPNAVYNVATANLGAAVISTGTSSTLRFSKNSTKAPDNYQTVYNNFIAYEDSIDWANTASLQTAMTQFISRKALNTASQQGLKYYVSTEVEQEFGASASQLSVNYYDEGLEYVGGDWVMPLGRTLSEIPAFLAAGLSGSIMLNHNVTNIAYSSTGVTVKSTSGGTTFTFSAKFAICTVPLGVLKKRGSTLFSPALPSAKQGAITRLGMGLLNKVILEFPSASINSGPFADGSWWISRLPEAAGDNGYWQEFFNLRRALNVPVLVAFQAGLPAVNAENSMSDAATIASVMSQLRTWYGSSWPSPVNTLVTRWWNDPWTFGSYSYYAVGCTGNERNAFQSPLLDSSGKGRVWFAGEHVSLDYPATMAGAFLTGQSAATAAMRAHPRTTTGRRH